MTEAERAKGSVAFWAWRAIIETASRMEVRAIRKAALLFLLPLILATPGFAGIRGAEWGMSKTEVRKLEGKSKAEREDRLIYSDLVAGTKTDVIYLFSHQKALYSIEYHFHLEHSIMTNALDQFEKISRILQDNYGAPDSGDHGLPREKKLGMLALEKPIEEGWEKNRVTYISHILLYEGGYKHILIYGHRALTDEYEAFLRQKEKEKF